MISLLLDSSPSVTTRRSDSRSDLLSDLLMVDKVTSSDLIQDQQVIDQITDTVTVLYTCSNTRTLLAQLAKRRRSNPKDAVSYFYRGRSF